jgi:hypothetical protein
MLFCYKDQTDRPSRQNIPNIKQTLTTKSDSEPTSQKTQMYSVRIRNTDLFRLFSLSSVETRVGSPRKIRPYQGLFAVARHPRRHISKGGQTFKQSSNGTSSLMHIGVARGISWYLFLPTHHQIQDLRSFFSWKAPTFS